MEDINKTLDEAILVRDIEKIRNILTTSMVQDPGFSKGVFEERLKRCLVAGISEEDIFVPFEGEAINSSQDAWTKDYYAEQRTEFRYNFSRERLEHLGGIGRKLFSPVKPTIASSAPKSVPTTGEPKKKSGGENINSTDPTGGNDKGFPKWFIPAGIGAGILLLLWMLFRRK